MIIFKTVKLQNFLSYGNNESEVNLQRTEPTLITGVNYDASSNGELDSNGAGKSSILMAISFALYNKPLCIENPKKNDLINNINKKDMLVTLELDSKGKNYVIQRFRKNKAMGGDGVKILENGKDITPDSIANADKYIAEHIMEIPYNIFGKIVVYAAGTDSFLKMDLSSQRNVIEELFSYSELSRKAEILKDKIKTNKTDLDYSKKINEDIRDEAKRHKEQLKEAKESHAEWEDENETGIKDCESKIEEFSKIDFEKEKKSLETLDTLQKELDKLDRNLDKIKSKIDSNNKLSNQFKNFEKNKIEKVNQLEAELKDYTITDEELEHNRETLEKLEEVQDEFKNKNVVVNRLHEELDRAGEKIKELSKEAKTLEKSTCPYCSQKYKEAKEKLKKVNEELDALTEEYQDRQKELETKEQESEKLEESIDSMKKESIFTSVRKVDQYISEKKRIASSLESEKNSENPYEDKADENEALSDEKNKIDEKMSKVSGKIEKLKTGCYFKSPDELYSTKSRIDTLEDKLSYLKDQANPYGKIIKTLEDYEPKESKDAEIDALIDDIKHQEFLLKLLTKKDSFIRKALMDKYLPFLNERLKYYLNTMGLPHKVQFKSDLTTEISQFDKDISYANLSSGQKARIDIAISLSFRDVLQSKHNFINLYILDECLDVGLSNVGIKKTLKLIKEVAENNKLSMLVISHRDEIRNSFKDSIEIELKNGFSSIK